MLFYVKNHFVLYLLRQVLLLERCVYRKNRVNRLVFGTRLSFNIIKNLVAQKLFQRRIALFADQFQRTVTFVTRTALENSLLLLQYLHQFLVAIGIILNLSVLEMLLNNITAIILFIPLAVFLLFLLVLL